MARKKSNQRYRPIKPTLSHDFERPKKAYKNIEFMDSPVARPIRVLSEFFEPQERFRKHRIYDTIVFFGSARFIPGEIARENLAKIQAAKRLGKTFSKEELHKAKVDHMMSRYYDECVELSKMMTEWSMGLKSKRRRFIVCSGGGPGVMEATSRGAYEAGGKSIGFNISIPFEQSGNPYTSKELSFEFHYFFIRKYWFAYMAKALVIFPGGFGTLDELAEILTLIQTKKITKPIPIVIYGRDYWNKVLHFEQMVEMGTISKGDLDLLHFCDTPKQAFQYLTKQLKVFYPS